ncbi:UDP-N-acetylmuramate dehydrogenase [Burkholderiaceae bacterium FT117]|uniref:UDP-N-acetylmuramate dehydrogenase n=1 Tax=Zeimonas sediminis TaxID=2944268 RepID=UPI0023430261|nr:UDP-N-acetylmuramate dehydrogenase [Zeimonas sediminis]MCM5569689.1 UDP-N-acetylmuramate dehydrogenase [Zeimonas sediminis]
MTLRIDEPASLRPFNSFGVDARASRLVTLEDPTDVAAALALLAEAPRALVLGGGSNLLLAGDFDGTVLRVALRGRRVVSAGENDAIVEAAAGENWHDFVCWTLDQGLHGLENLSLIPGTVGASPIQNIGAYGVEMRERFDSLEAVDRHTGERRRLGPADCRFGYRDSVFKHPDGERWLILSVRFRLSRSFEPVLDYGELRAELSARAAAPRSDGSGHRDTDRRNAPATADGSPPPDAREVAAAVVAIRRRKLPDPAVLGNAGSFFRNPVVDAAQADALAAAHSDMPRHPAGPEAGPGADGRPRVKLSAGWLIERCGWKGHREGDAGVHERHALVLVNHGNATGAQLLALAERIRASVRERFGVALEPEPTIVR